MKNRIVKKILRIILLTIVGAAVIGTFYFLWKKAQPVITVYEVVTPKRDTVETKTVATGSVEPRYEVEIKPQISGIISELRKEAGQMVQAGEIIATIKVIPEMVQLNSAESRVNIADISLKQVEETYKRDELLFKQGVIAQEDFDLSKANYLKAVEEKANAQSALEIIRDGIAKNSNVASTTQIRSTITGMILDIPVKVGNSVIQANNFNDGTTIATVANMNDMIFKGNVDETEIGRIHEGMPIKLTIGAMESRSFEALLEYVSPKGVEKNGAIQFEIKAQLAKDEVTLTESQNNVNLALLDLAQSLELERSDRSFDIQTPVIEDAVADNMSSILPPENIYDHAVTFKPQIKEQQYLLESQKKMLRVAQAGYYPKLNFGASYSNGYYHSTSGGEFADTRSFSEQFKQNGQKIVGFSLSIPLFNRFQVRNSVRTARINIINRELLMENTKKTLYKEIQQAYYNATASQEKYTASDKSVTASKEAFNYAQERYNAGKSTVFEFNEAKTKYAQSLAEQAQAKYDFIFRTKILDFYNGNPIRL